MGKKAEIAMELKYYYTKYEPVYNRYFKMVEELFEVSKDDLCSKRRDTTTIRFARMIYTYHCRERLVPFLTINASLGRTSNASIYNYQKYKDLYGIDEYFTHLADMAISWDKNH